MTDNLPSIFDRKSRRGLTEAALANIGGGLMPPQVSIRGGRFALIDAGGMRTPLTTMHMDCLIIDINQNKSKLFWGEDQKYDPNNADPSPPICFSDNGVSASADAQDPQSATCAECKWNAWGSSINEQTGANRKACSDRKKAAILALGDPTRTVYQLQIPPASLKGFATYSGKLQAMLTPDRKYKCDMDDVVTRVTFADGQTGVLQFNAVAWLSSVMDTQNGLALALQGGQAVQAADGGQAVGGLIDQIVNSGATDVIVNRSDKPWRGTPSAALAAVGGQPQPLLSGLKPATESSSGFTTVPLPAALPSRPLQPQPLTGNGRSHGGARPGAGRPRTKKQAAAPQAAPQQEASPLQPLTAASPQPSAGFPGGGPGQALPSNPAFATPESLTSELDRALDTAFNLDTGE